MQPSLGSILGLDLRMIEFAQQALLPAVLTGLAFLVAVAAAGWIGERVFGYRPKGYQERLRSQNYQSALDASCSEDLRSVRTKLSQIRHYILGTSDSASKHDFVAAREALDAARRKVWEVAAVKLQREGSSPTLGAHAWSMPLSMGLVGSLRFRQEDPPSEVEAEVERLRTEIAQLDARLVALFTEQARTDG